MSFVREAVRDKPRSLFMLDDTAPYQDYSGYNRVGTVAGGTPVTQFSLVSGASVAPVFTSAITATFPTDVFKQGYERDAFSLEVWARLASALTSDQQILGNSGQMDGFLLNSTVVSFALKFLTAGTITLSHDLQANRVVHLVAVYTGYKISLYVNGELVDEESLTEAQILDTFVVTGANLHSGATIGSQQIALNGVATYATALSGEIIERHYRIGATRPSPDDVISSFGGIKYIPSLEYTNNFFDHLWDSEEEWSNGVIHNLSVENDLLIPQEDEGVSLPGRWYNSINLDFMDITSIYGIMIDWAGTGITVDTSLDGTTWTPATRNRLVSNIASGFNPTGQHLQIRVSFVGGITDDPAYLEWIRITGVQSGVTASKNGRTITLVGGHPQRDDKPLSDLHQDWAVRLPGITTTFTISADTSPEAIPVRTVEILIRRLDTSGTPTTSAPGFVGGFIYENGALGDGAYSAGQWVLAHVVSSTNLVSTIAIRGPVEVAHMALYETAFSATQVAEVYQTYVGTKKLTVDDSTGLTMPEGESGHKIYAHDWAILSSG